eukprot:284819134_2
MACGIVRFRDDMRYPVLMRIFCGVRSNSRLNIDCRNSSCRVTHYNTARLPTTNSSKRHSGGGSNVLLVSQSHVAEISVRTRYEYRVSRHVDSRNVMACRELKLPDRTGSETHSSRAVVIFIVCRFGDQKWPNRSICGSCHRIQWLGRIRCRIKFWSCDCHDVAAQVEGGTKRGVIGNMNEPGTRRSRMIHNRLYVCRVGVADMYIIHFCHFCPSQATRMWFIEKLYRRLPELPDLEQRGSHRICVLEGGRRLNLPYRLGKIHSGHWPHHRTGRAWTSDKSQDENCKQFLTPARTVANAIRTNKPTCLYPNTKSIQCNLSETISDSKPSRMT